MIRFCPNCQTERAVQEAFCEGALAERLCGWDLSGESIREPGWRPQQVVTGGTAAPPLVPPGRCEQGHAMVAGDLICMICGGDRVDVQEGHEQVVAIPDESAPVGTAATETSIAGWKLLRQIGSSDGMRDRYIATHDEDGRQAVLTLYRAGAEPDPSVYQVLRRLPRDHVPEILATGRWDDRAFEVAEELTGGTLAELGIVVSDLTAVRHVVAELGRALHSFSEAGLRHRDLRPATLLVRSREPLDLVITGFGSARLSEFDLDIVSPLETSRYMAPEAVAGGVAAASDWWSLGMVLLEQVTAGTCFEGINPHAYLIHVLANGVPLPEDLDPSLHLLLRGLLARDRHQRWQWPQVQSWLNGEPVSAPPPASSEADSRDGASITLDKRRYFKPALFALAAAEAENWQEALDHLLRGVIATWAESAHLAPKILAGLRQVAQHDGLEDDFRLMLALKLLNPEMPLIQRGEIVTPGWLLNNPLEGYRLISGTVPDMLERMEADNWLSRLKERAEQVRNRARGQDIQLDEEALRIHLLSTSRARLSALWEERRRLLPDTPHGGLLSLADRSLIGEEDLIVLLSASISQFRSSDAIVEEARQLSEAHGINQFNAHGAQALLQHTRQELYRLVDDRVADFVRCGVVSVDEWSDQFRLERRMPLAKALALLAVPADRWLAPQKQQYVAQILNFFEKKVATAVLRGPLVRMSIGKTTARVDLNELGSERRPSSALLDHLLQRNEQPTPLDPTIFAALPALANRLNALHRHNTLYKRDTGIDGLYLGFPFLLTRDPRGNTKTRIAPLLLWPMRLMLELGARGQVSLGFDSEREEVRLNPALESLLGPESTKAWRKAADELLGRSSLKVADVMDAFGMLVTARSRTLASLPPVTTEVAPYKDELACAAVLFHVTFMGQAIGEDLRQLQKLPPGGTGLETALRLKDRSTTVEALAEPRELDRFFVVASDPSQEAAVLQARTSPGLLIEGPPGTGKSQTIVNMVADAIGRERSMLIVCQKHAALEVVRKRLVAEGLGNRIVMINDVNRDREPTVRGVREQLEALFRRAGNPAGVWQRQRERVAARIEALESELDRYHEALHHVDERIGLSYRALLGELVSLEDGTPPLDFPGLRPRLSAMDIGSLSSLEESCAPLARYWLPARYEGSPLAHLEAFATDKATLDAFERALRTFSEVERTRAATLAANQCSFEVDDPVPHRLWLEAHARALLALSDHQRRQLACWLPMFRPTGQTNTEGRPHLVALRRLKGQLEACDQSSFSVGLSPALSALQVAELNALSADVARATAPASWLGRLNPFRYRCRRRANAFVTAHGDPSGTTSAIALLNAARLEQAWRPLRDELARLHHILGLSVIQPSCGLAMTSHVSAALQQLEGVCDLAEHLSQAPRGDQIDSVVLSGRRDLLVQLLAGFDAAFVRHSAREASKEALQRLEDWFEPSLRTSFHASIEANAATPAVLDRLIAALPQLSAYQQFRARAQQLPPATLELLALLRDKQAELEAIPIAGLETQVRRLLNREARLGWKRRIEQEHPALLLEQAETATKIESLTDADEQMRRLNRSMLSEGMNVASLHALKDWEDITRLTGKRARRLREFIELGADLGLMNLRPIWLMNPDVASRVLPLKAALFDTVVYDEASQMPVEFALPTLFRGRVAVVSGDEKQMPPTAFFSSRIESDESEFFDGETPDDEANEEERSHFEDTWNRREIKDCPDLLQLARTVLPTTTLKIHYRSAYRELIGFSNASFYRNELSVPVRHPQAKILDDQPVQLIRTDSLYQNQTNEGEAERIVELLADMWRQPYAERSSVGVVTFNRKQADLIEERLELRAEQDMPFRAAYREESERTEGGEDMGVFVKNVENVQGDERDIIIFSSTFGRNSQGTFRRTFGVLGQSGGERRLNVAVTRAKQKVVMVTSMPIADISDMLATKRKPIGPRDYLQGYMEYARALSSGEFSSGDALLARMSSVADVERQHRPQTRDGFTEAVEAYVHALGWSLSSVNEGDAFSLDFAIEDSSTGMYAIGIECDAPRHDLLSRARAREIWRPQVLQKAIPKLHRVSSQGWYHEGENERARLRDAIETAMNSGGSA